LLTTGQAPAIAADVTPERLVNPEPGNWLMNHRTYDGQRFSPLARINRDTVKGLKLAYARGHLGGPAGTASVRPLPSPVKSLAGRCDRSTLQIDLGYFESTAADTPRRSHKCCLCSMLPPSLSVHENDWRN
jgi:hypothetical protein